MGDIVKDQQSQTLNRAVKTDFIWQLVTAGERAELRLVCAEVTGVLKGEGGRGRAEPTRVRVVNGHREPVSVGVTGPGGVLLAVMEVRSLASHGEGRQRPGPSKGMALRPMTGASRL